VSTLPLVALRGTPREQGRQHGEALRDRIHHNVELYLHRFATDARLTREEVERRAAAYLEVFTRQSPPYREVMEGIAEASGRTLPEIAMLNARYEILYSAYSAIGMAEAAGECTAFAAARTVTADGHLWIGQTWDWIPDVRGALLDMEEDGLRILAFTEAGIAGGKIGMNSAGIGLVINGLLSNLDDWSRLGVPFHLRTSGILRSRTMSEAVAQATEGVHACSANFLIARGTGGRPGGAEEVIDLETSPGGWVSLTPSDGTLVHANHFLEPERLPSGSRCGRSAPPPTNVATEWSGCSPSVPLPGRSRRTTWRPCCATTRDGRIPSAAIPTRVCRRRSARRPSSPC